jgi:F-type H+-transporting ATPase subunit alpha
LDARSDEIVAIIKQEIKRYKSELNVSCIGIVVQVSDGIAVVYGLQDAMSGELVEFENNASGMVMNLEVNQVGVMLLTNLGDVCAGTRAKLTGKVLEVNVGKSLLGRVVNALGEAIDDGVSIECKTTRPIEKIAPGIIERGPVNVPLQTGIKAIDTMVPIGRGQRELIIGDRQTGKTAMCIDIIINQKNENVLCVYVAIGQKMSSIVKLVSVLKDHDALSYTTVVVASASDSAALQYIAPYSGCAIAEEFMSQGKDVLIIYDDLSKHAVAYRTMSLLLKRPPGREAYPGDIFYLHSRLLERAAKLSVECGGGSLTALPIVETQSGDVSAYIPTNVISITDGQIYLESGLFNSGIRPAINPGLSVSRVGGNAQTKAMKKISSSIRTELAQYRELEVFAQFGSELDKNTAKRIKKGKYLVEILKQKQYSTMSIEDEIVILYVVTHDYLLDVPIDKIYIFEKDFLDYMHKKKSFLMQELHKKREIDNHIEDQIKKSIDVFLSMTTY